MDKRELQLLKSDKLLKLSKIVFIASIIGLAFSFVLEIMLCFSGGIAVFCEPKTALFGIPILAIAWFAAIAFTGWFVFLIIKRGILETKTKKAISLTFLLIAIALLSLYITLSNPALTIAGLEESTPRGDLGQSIQFTRECFVENNERIVCQGTVKNLSNETIRDLALYLFPDQYIGFIVASQCPIKCIGDSNRVFKIKELGANQSTAYTLSCLTQNKVNAHLRIILINGFAMSIYYGDCPKELFD